MKEERTKQKKLILSLLALLWFLLSLCLLWMESNMTHIALSCLSFFLLWDLLTGGEKKEKEESG